MKVMTELDVQLQKVLRGRQFKINLNKSYVLHTNEKADRHFDLGEYGEAFELFSKTAALGDPYGVWMLYVCLRDGIGVEADANKAVSAAEKYSDRRDECGVSYSEFQAIESSEENVRVLETAVARGDKNACFELGLYYYFGKIVKKDLDKAEKLWLEASASGHSDATRLLGFVAKQRGDDARFLEWLQKAAKAENAEAHYDLGRYYQELYEFDESDGALEKALFHYGKAAWAGHTEARFALGCYDKEAGCFAEEYSLGWTPSNEALDWLQKAADAGHPDAMYMLGSHLIDAKMNYLDGEFLLKKSASLGNCDAALALADRMFGEELINLLVKFASRGYDAAQYRLSNEYLAGENVERSRSKAIEWLEKASHQNHYEAMDELITLYSDRSYGVPNYSKILSMCKTLEVRYPTFNAINTIGECYLYGRGVDKNPQKAVEYFKSAAKGETAAALKARCNLAFCYMKGEGLPLDYDKAAVEFGALAALGQADAVNYLGDCYFYGRGVEQNYGEALRLYKRAAELNQADAYNNLATCYFNGYGVDIDEKAAATYYQKAAELGDDFGQYNIGVCYENGIGVVRNISRAAYWYKKSEEYGNPDAKAALDKMR